MTLGILYGSALQLKASFEDHRFWIPQKQSYKGFAFIFHVVIRVRLILEVE